MRAGGLDRRVTIQRFTETQDPYGEPILTWSDLATVFAEVRQQGGREYLAAATLIDETRVVFYIRWYPGLTPLDRVIYGGRLHNIKEVREIGRRDGVELHTISGDEVPTGEPAQFDFSDPANSGLLALLMDE